jgi:hypothetical protein
MPASADRYSDLDSSKVLLSREDEGLRIRIDGTDHSVDRIARLFPRTNPDHYVSFLNPGGHEIGMIDDPGGLDAASRDLLTAELKATYFVPTILEVRSVKRQGTGSQWDVLTDDGDMVFRLQSMDALDGSEPPAISIRDDNGKRYRIKDYWDLDKDSRGEIADMLPRNLLRARFGRSSQGSGRGSSGRGSSMSGV